MNNFLTQWQRLTQRWVRLLPVLLLAGAACKSNQSTPAPASGNAVFWNDESTVATVTVALTGQGSQTIQYTLAAAPACGSSQAASFSVPAGTYTYTASASGQTTLTGSVSITAGGCTAQLVHFGSGTGGGTGGGTGSGTTTGSAMFWASQNLGTITVRLGTATGTISGYYAAQPSCGASYSANFGSLSPGSYAFSASSGSGSTWSGTVTVAAGQCFAMQLLPSTGGGTGGGTTTGTLTLWTATDHQCGNILVTVNGSSQNIANYFTSGTPNCGASGTASFTLAPGTYNYSARCSTLTWSGTATVTASGCSRIQLL